MQHTQHLLEIMQKLRDPESGCPWDLEQNFNSIAPYTIEEAYEVADAIAKDDMTELKSELGDLLFQVVFHSQMANEQQLFTFEDVAKMMCEKMIRRHPHIFSDATITSADEQNKNWEAIKQIERKGKQQHGLLDDIPHALPALLRAHKIQKRASSVNFDWTNIQSVMDKVHEELQEVEEAIEEQDTKHIEEEIGDLLFVVANLSRKLGIRSEEALRKANHKFERRFRFIEDTINAREKDMATTPLDELEKLWQQAKQEEKNNAA